MTLKPIPGAPPGAPIPDFPTGEPGPLVVPNSRFVRRPASLLPASSAPPRPSPSLAPAHPPGPVAIRGSGDSTLTFRVNPEIPAINRSSMIISITGDPTGACSPQMPRHLDLAIDKASAFLLALRDGASIVIVDSRTAVQLEFAVTDDGPTFTISKLGQERTSRKFNPGLGYNVTAMAAHLLAALGP